MLSEKSQCLFPHIQGFFITVDARPREGLRSARKDVDVRRQKGESCVGMGERLKKRGAVWTWK